MSKTTSRGWLAIAADAAVLGVEGYSVVWLRTARLLGGGDPAKREAQLMVTEKIEAHGELVRAIIAGEHGSTPKSMTAGTVRHYLDRVRANRQRLSRR